MREESPNSAGRFPSWTAEDVDKYSRPEWRALLELGADVSRMARSFEMDATLLAISRSMIDESRRLLTALQGERAILKNVDAALLASSRSMIDESKRLLTTLTESASSTSGSEAHYQPTVILTGSIETTAAASRAPSDADRGTLSVRIHQEGTRFGWTVYSPTKSMLGCGTAETELKARADAFRAGMTYIERQKGHPAPDDVMLH